MALGKATDALESIRQAIKIHRHLRDQLPERYEPLLASSLFNMATYLHKSVQPQTRYT